MRIGVVGRGGTGRTTVAALVAQAHRERGSRVIAIDTDAIPNLGMSLGLDAPAVAAARLVPRGMAAGIGGRLTPAELVAEYGLATPAGVTLLHAMRAERDGERCFCLGHANPRSSMAAVPDEEADVTVFDMEAGLEHLMRGGGSLAHVDRLLVVSEPSRKSMLAAARTLELAAELGVSQVSGVGNKARVAEDYQFFANAAIGYGMTFAGVVPFAASIAEADRYGTMLGSLPAAVRDAITQIMDFEDLADEPGPPRPADRWSDGARAGTDRMGIRPPARPDDT
jgi:CO dehydrogenase maturation factor